MSKEQTASFLVWVFYVSSGMFWPLAVWIFVRPHNKRLAFLMKLRGYWIIRDHAVGDILYCKKEMPSAKACRMALEFPDMRLYRPCLPVSRRIGVILIVEVVTLTICHNHTRDDMLSPVAQAIWTMIAAQVALAAIVVGYYIVAKTETRLAAFAGRLMAGYGALNIGLVLGKLAPDIALPFTFFGVLALAHNLVRTPIGSKQHYT